MLQLLTLRPMLLLRLLPTVALAAALSAQAAPSQPPTSQEDDLQRFVADKRPDGPASARCARGSPTTTSELVVTAMGFLGVPYRRGGNTRRDRLRLQRLRPRDVRADRRPGAAAPRRTSRPPPPQTIDKRDLQPGDLVFFNTMRRAFSHVGIYVGEGKFIHSPKPGAAGAGRRHGRQLLAAPLRRRPPGAGEPAGRLRHRWTAAAPRQP